MQAAAGIDARDAASASADGLDVELRQADHHAVEQRLVPEREPAAGHHRDIRARPAHVVGDEVRDAGSTRQMHRSGNAGCGTRRMVRTGCLHTSSDDVSPPCEAIV